MGYDYMFGGTLTFTHDTLAAAIHYLDWPAADAFHLGRPSQANVNLMAYLLGETFGITLGAADIKNLWSVVTYTLTGTGQFGSEKNLLHSLASYAVGHIYGTGDDGDHWVWVLCSDGFIEIVGQITYPGFDELTV